MNKLLNWISIKDRLPEHHQTVYVYSSKGQCVCVFVDSVEMNKTLKMNGYANEAVDVKKHPYYFCSQEVKSHTLNKVSHWMPLMEPPTHD